MKHAGQNGHVIHQATRTLNIGGSEAAYSISVVRRHGLQYLTIASEAGEPVVSLSLVPFSDQMEAVKQGMIGGNEIIANLIDAEAGKQGVHIYKDARLELARFLVEAVKIQAKDTPRAR